MLFPSIDLVKRVNRFYRILHPEFVFFRHQKRVISFPQIKEPRDFLYMSAAAGYETDFFSVRHCYRLAFFCSCRWGKRSPLTGNILRSQLLSLYSFIEAYIPTHCALSAEFRICRTTQATPFVSHSPLGKKALFYIASSSLKILCMVFSRILISSFRLQCSIYSVSSFTTCSKSVMLLLPLVCQRPVMPGSMLSLRL